MRALLSYFTVLPVRNVSLSAAATQAHLLPLVGLVTALPGVAVFLVGYALPPGVSATLALGAVLLAAGLHHADGVLDVGDAIMVRGTPERRREVLKDARVGIGGIGGLFLIYAPALAALVALAGGSPLRAALALLAGEVASRAAMLLMLCFGRPAQMRSSTAPFVNALTGTRRSGGILLALLGPLPFLLPFGVVGLMAGFSAPLLTVAALPLARRYFGGISGDVVGTTGETVRAVVLVIVSATV